MKSSLNISGYKPKWWIENNFLGMNKRIKLELKLNIENQFELCEIKWSCKISSKWTKDSKGEKKEVWDEMN